MSPPQNQEGRIKHKMVSMLRTFQEGKDCVAVKNPWRSGMNQDTWSVFIDALLPEAVLVVGESCSGTGLPLAVFMFNDKRFGIDKTPLVVCQSDVSKRLQHVLQAHGFHHNLDRAITAYAGWRFNASKVASVATKEAATKEAARQPLQRHNSNPSNTGEPKADTKAAVDKELW